MVVQPSHESSSSERRGCSGLPPLSAQDLQGGGLGDLLSRYTSWVEVSDLFVGGPVPYKFYGGSVHLLVQPWPALLAALAEETSLPPSALAQQHAGTYYGDDGLMRPLYPPSEGVHVGNNLALSHCSTSLMDNPVSLAHSPADWDLCNLSP